MEPESQQPETGARKPKEWDPAVWAPIGLIVGHALLMLLVNPIGSSADGNELWPLTTLGMFFSQPLLCGFWAAFTTKPIVFRLPVALAACVFLGLTLCVNDGDIGGVLFYLVLFVVFAAVFAGGSKMTSLKLTTQFQLADAHLPNRFNVRYLFICMTIVALMLSLGKYIAEGRGDQQPESVWERASLLTSMTLVFGIALTPVIATIYLVFRPASRFAVWIPVVVISCAVTSFVTVLLIYWIEPMSTSQPLVSAWMQFASLSMGAIVSAFVTCGVLRFAGYRLVRG